MEYNDKTVNNQTNKTCFRLIDCLDSETKIFYAYITAFSLVGLCGNTLSILIFQCTELRKMRSIQALTVLAVFDILSQINTVLSFLIELVDFNIGVLCIFNELFLNLTTNMSSWLVVLYAIERLVFVYRPLSRYEQRPSLDNIEKFRFIILFGFCALPTVIMLVELVSASSVRELKTCRPVKWARILEVLSVSFTYMLPFAIIFTANVLVAVKVLRNLIELKRGYSLPTFLFAENTTAEQLPRLETNLTELMICQWNRRYFIKRRTKEAKKTVLTLLVMSAEFIVLNMALPVFFYHQLYVEANGVVDSRKSIETLRIVSLALNFSNYCVNFFLYWIHIPKFKEGFYRLMKR